jgi:site-specific DNA-methyltransferase (adenine-specific)
MKHGGPHHIPRVEEDKNASRFFNTLRDGEATADKRYTEKGSTSFSMLPGQRRFDTGSPARFFYTAKPSRKERNLGLDSERFPKGNEHTTVKPLALLRWLQRLVTPPGGTTLDPFLGSGTSAMAAAQEGFNFIGIELDPQWLPVQIARTLAASPDTTIVSENEVTQ